MTFSRNGACAPEGGGAGGHARDRAAEVMDVDLRLRRGGRRWSAPPFDRRVVEPAQQPAFM